MAFPAAPYHRVWDRARGTCCCKDEPVIGVEQRETVGNGLDCGLDHAALFVSVRRQFYAFDNTSAKQFERAGHGPEYVGRGCGNRYFKIAA